MPIRFEDIGLGRVWLANGYSERIRDGTRSVRYENLDGLFRSLALSLVRKPARLTSGEFRWLRRYLDISQEELGGIVDRDPQTISLIERGKWPAALIDRELRRVAIEMLLPNGLRDSVSVFAKRTAVEAEAVFFGRLLDDVWHFDVSVVVGSASAVNLDRVNMLDLIPQSRISRPARAYGQAIKQSATTITSGGPAIGAPHFLGIGRPTWAEMRYSGSAKATAEARIG